MSTAYVTWKPLLQRRLQDLSRSQVLTTRILKGKYDIQVRLSRATLEFQVLQVPTGLKVFNSQVIRHIGDGDSSLWTPSRHQTDTFDIPSRHISAQ